MKSAKIVYSVYVPTSTERVLLDAMRLLAKPDCKHASHITVRGPYSDYQDSREWTMAIRGKLIKVSGVGTFFGDKQNTVYLGVDSAAINGIMYKPDYPDGVPHLTIYDGDSRAIAEAVRDILTKFDLSFSFRADGVEPMIFGNGQRTLYKDLLLESMRSWKDELVTTIEQDLDEVARLESITRLAHKFSSLHCVAA